jgi:hypothetical protein
MRLIALDFPTFERPAKATSTPMSSGICDCLVAPSKNVGLHKSAGMDTFELFILDLWLFAPKNCYGFAVAIVAYFTA